MKMKKSLRLIAILISCCGTSLGQNTERPTYIQPGPPAYIPKVGSFQKIQGDSAKQILDLIEFSDLAKSEFETNKEYIERIKTWSKKTINPVTKKSLDQTVFVFEDDVAKYDAENREFIVEAPRTKLQTFGSSGRDSPIFYTAWTGERWRTIYDLKTKFSAMPEAARVIKPDLAIAVWGSPVGSRSILEFAPFYLVVFNKKTSEIYAVKRLSDPFASPSD